MVHDPSRGWDAAANEFLALRSQTGAETVRQWARRLPAGGTVLDVGCGSGIPISAALIEAGLRVYGVDASPKLIAAFRSRFPTAEAVCEPAETSPFFHRSFDGAVAIGLLFLLPAPVQLQIIQRISNALHPGGRFLFSAPQQACEWRDALTGQPSASLGEDTYRQALETSGMVLAAHYVDEGENHHYDAVRRASPR